MFNWMKTWNYLDKKETPEQKAKRIGVPVVPKRPEPSPSPNNPTIAVCGQCGLELQQVMHYVCPNSNCPCRLGSRVTL